MADVVFRNTQSEVRSEHTAKSVTPDVDGEAEVESPYTEFEAENGKTYLADRFTLGDKLDVFADELSTIDKYIDEQISTGKIANTVKAVEKLLKDIESLTNITNEDRSVIKIETIAAYINFLNTTDQARKDFGKYN